VKSDIALFEAVFLVWRIYLGQIWIH